MQTAICRSLGIDAPIFAFTHCRDVAVEVSKAGGLGCLGSAFMTPAELKEHLDWMDAKVGDKPYGVDILFNPRQPGKGAALTIEQVDDKVWGTIPQAHRDFAEKLLLDAGVPAWPEPDRPSLRSMAYEMAFQLFEETLRHPKCKVIVSAMGTPPTEIVDAAHRHGQLIGALSGTRRHGIQHKEAGLDFVVANGNEGGGHTGAIGSMVLWPEMVDAVAPLPVLAAGGVANGRQMLAALAMGAQGVWTGSLWLTVAEAQTQPAERQRYLQATTADTVISKSWSGKNARFLRNRWTEAWEGPESPGILPNPAQWLLTADARRRTERYGEVGQAQEVAFSGAGQAVGLINEVEASRAVVARLIREYLEAYEHVTALMPQA
ncbi:MAG: nitronate monooxygenase family protein [Rubrivivax sp.]